VREGADGGYLGGKVVFELGACLGCLGCDRYIYMYVPYHVIARTFLMTQERQVNYLGSTCHICVVRNMAGQVKWSS